MVSTLTFWLHFTFYLLRPLRSTWPQAYLQPTSVGVNVSWQLSHNNTRLLPFRWTSWKALSLLLRGPTGIQPQLTVIFITHTHIELSSVLVSLFPLTHSLTHDFQALFQINTFSMTLWLCLRSSFGRTQTKKKIKVWEIDKPAFIWDAFAILWGK